MVSDNRQRRRQTTPIILSDFERTKNVNRKHGHTAKDKSEIKKIKYRAEEAKVPVLLYNE